MKLIRHHGRWKVLRNGELVHGHLEGLALARGYRVGEVCGELGVSEPYFRAVVLRDIGLSPKEWMRRERMVMARRMLVAGEESGRVAGVLGFADHNSFRREFRSLHGVTAGGFFRLRRRFGIGSE